MSQNPRMGREQSEASSAVSLAPSFSLGSSLLQFLLEVTFPWFSFAIGSSPSSWGDQSSEVPRWWGRFPGWFYPQRLPGWGEPCLSIKIDFFFFSSPEQLRMADMTWNEEMKNKTSSAFSILATKVEKEMEEALKERKLNLTVVVAELLPGSVRVRLVLSCIRCWYFMFTLHQVQIVKAFNLKLVLRCESSTLILCKELSSPIFQSCQSVSQSVRHR